MDGREEARRPSLAAWSARPLENPNCFPASLVLGHLFLIETLPVTPIPFLHLLVCLSFFHLLVVAHAVVSPLGDGNT